MFETYININTNEEVVIIKEKSISYQYKLLIMLLILLSFNFAMRLDAKIKRKLIKYTGGNFYEDNSLVNYNRYYINNYVPDVKTLDYFNITRVNYEFSLKYNLIRMEYDIRFYEENDTLISPSDFALYKELQIICVLEIIDPMTIIYSYPNVKDNKYYQCIEYFDSREKVFIGIKIYQYTDYLKAFHIKFFTEQKFNLNNFFYQNENRFEPFFVNNQYLSVVQNFNKNLDKDNPILKSTYLQYPYCTLKRKAIKDFDKWYFRNIYNDHFCFCVGTACLLNVDQKCKQLFFMKVIDHNQHLYEKTDYLFVDFIFGEYSYDDTYPVFEEMYVRNYHVHYMTENKDILDAYCHKQTRCEPILYVHRGNYTINGDFVEKYLTLILKLKAVVCARQLNFFNNLFYNTDYITYITIAHSSLYFKFFSEEKDVLEKRKFDKIILPPSEKVINLAKSFGWTDADILQINFPRWDKYNNLPVKNKTYIYKSDINIVTENIINKESVNYSQIIYIEQNNTKNFNDDITNITNIINITNINDNITNINTNITNIYDNNTKINDNITNITNITNINDYITYINDNITNINDNSTNINDNITNITNIIIPMREKREIFMMFTWRSIIKECEISDFYFDNISKIFESELLIEELKKNNVHLYFTIHGLVYNKYRSTYKSILNYKKNMRFIDQDEIAKMIAKSELIITDYSSLMFDFVYMRRPYILYIPDLNDPDVEEIYKPEYSEFYRKIREGEIKFENMVYSVNELINKIIYYINNDFILEDNIGAFYDSFGIEKGNNTEKLINYLVHNT